jgi:hypothetical protein
MEKATTETTTLQISPKPSFAYLQSTHRLFRRKQTLLKLPQKRRGHALALEGEQGS